MTPKQYCQEKASKSGSSFYYSFMFLPKQKREAIIALYAFCREVDDVVDECTELKVAQVKLAWWKDEVRNLYLKKPIHPVTKALEQVIHQYQLDEEHFHEIIDGMEMDLNFNRYEDFKQLQLYCYRVASVVGILSAQIFGFENRKTLKFAHDLGMAFQLTNIIRDVGEDARRNRIYIPLDELAKFNVTEDDILKSRESDAVKKLLDAQIERAEMYYDKALNELPADDKNNQRVGLIMTAIYRTLLREIKADGAEKVLNARISLGTLRKLWIAFSTWLKHLV
ncbi:MAG: presqualene diphosphate synthase HpnD [Methylotenera sp.]|jgi:phytoene synthase|uniref:presqualene diphosphate synthase HpnD n=1 Tax=Methylotenera sp. TaxID=2051956 RepID=UPI0027237706|nr:presqualene diphosphate synthase HpnD [Methylotenera sp.]MDO9150970.1 presqualene diphosphate synthase HpnD [Methylotenera sp.]